jgi:hypothetical protein
LLTHQAPCGRAWALAETNRVPFTDYSGEFRTEARREIRA